MFQILLFCVLVRVWVGGERNGRSCPPVRDDIVPSRHLFFGKFLFIHFHNSQHPLLAATPSDLSFVKIFPFPLFKVSTGSLISNMFKTRSDSQKLLPLLGGQKGNDGMME